MASAGSLAEALEQLRQGCEELDLQSVGIGDEGAKELAAALKANTTLTELYLWGACRGAALATHPRGTAARARTRAEGGRAARTRAMRRNPVCRTAG